MTIRSFLLTFSFLKQINKLSALNNRPYVVRDFVGEMALKKPNETKKI